MCQHRHWRAWDPFRRRGGFWSLQNSSLQSFQNTISEQLFKPAKPQLKHGIALSTGEKVLIRTRDRMRSVAQQNTEFAVTETQTGCYRKCETLACARQVSFTFANVRADMRAIACQENRIKASYTSSLRPHTRAIACQENRIRPHTLVA